MIPLTPVSFTTSLEDTFPEARTQISFLLTLRSDPSPMYALVVAWGNRPRPMKPSDENGFSVWFGFKAVYWKRKVCLLPAFQGHNKSLTASSYMIKILQVLLQILEQPKILTDISLFLLPQVSGSFLLELLWHMKQGTCHRHIYSHLSINKKS